MFGPMSALRGVGASRYEGYLLGHSRVLRLSYFLVLFIKDWETKVGADKLSRMKLPHHSGLNADPNLKFV